ncbi:ABC transporter substrate-binding protein, partial [Bacillus haynesii]
MTKKQYSYILTVLLAFAVFLSGCQSGQKQAASEKNEEKTRVVKTINGNVTVPANPKRVVTIGYAGTMLAFGIKPLGETGKYLGSPYIKDQVSGIKDIGGKDGFSVSVEKILELKPDLIVSMTNDSKEYEKLSKIAPTVVYPFGTFKDARDEMKTFGKLLGKEKEAREWTKTFNQKMKAARAKIKDASVQGET